MMMKISLVELHFKENQINQSRNPMNLITLNSRVDDYFGDPQPFNATVFAETVSYWTTPIINIKQGATAYLARLATSKKTNPEFMTGVPELREAVAAANARRAFDSRRKRR